MGKLGMLGCAGMLIGSVAFAGSAVAGESAVRNVPGSGNYSVATPDAETKDSGRDTADATSDDSEAAGDGAIGNPQSDEEDDANVADDGAWSESAHRFFDRALENPSPVSPEASNPYARF